MRVDRARFLDFPHAPNLNLSMAFDTMPMENHRVPAHRPK